MTIKNIGLYKLLESDIFCHQFDFYEWPQTHTDDRNLTLSYNGSIFNLRSQYDKIFENKIDDDQVEEGKEIFKIKYTLNLLPNMGYH